MSPRVAPGNGRVELPLDRKRRRGNGRAGARPSRYTFVAVATDSPTPQASDCLSEANPQGRKGPSATLPYIHDGEGAVATTPARGHKTTIHQLPSTNYHLPTAIHQLPSTNCHLPTTNYQLPTTNFSIFRIVTAPAGRRPTRSRRRSRPPRPSASVLPHRPAPSGRTPRADASAAVPFLGLQL